MRLHPHIPRESVGMEPPVAKNDPIRKMLCSVSAQLLPVRQCLCSLCSNLSIISIMHIWEHRDKSNWILKRYFQESDYCWQRQSFLSVQICSSGAFIPQVCWPNDGIKWRITGRRPSRHELLLVIQSVSLCDGYAQSWAASMASSLRINNLWDSVCICSYYITTL